METNLGFHGATRQSWERDAARVAFKEVYDTHPTAGEYELAELLRGRGFEDTDIDRAVYRYTVHNMLKALEGYGDRVSGTRRQMPMPEQAALRKAALDATVASMKAQVMLLNLPMPNGKLARNCTGEELIEIGGSWVKVGKKIGKYKVLGQELDENEVRKLMLPV